MRKTHSTRIGLLFAVAGTISLVLGIQLGSRSEKVHRNALELSRLDQVSTSSRLLSEAVQSELAAIRQEAESLASGARPIAASREKYPRILHLAVFHRGADGLHLLRSGFRLSEAGRTGLHSADGGSWESAYLRSVQRGLSLHPIDEHGMAVFPFRPDDQGTAEWIALAFADPTEAGQVDVALVDPAHVFNPIFGEASSAGARFYLLDSHGVVLAHSQPSYVGSRFRIPPKHPGRVIAMDRLPVYAASNRPGQLALILGAERVATEAVTFPYQQTGLWVLGIALWAIALSVLALIALRSLKQDDDEHSEFEYESHVLTTAAVQDAVAPSDVMEAIDTLQEEQAAKARERTELESAREALRVAREEQAFVAEYERQAQRIRDPKHVARRFAEASAELCRSPTLFFAYHESAGSALLVAGGGYSELEAPIGMSFPIDAAAIERIREIEKSGQTASLAHYEPLTRILLARLGVAHFEAWAVTACGELGRVAGKSRLLGVLVILQSGVDTVSRHESLSRMMRTTGLIYENALLAQ